MAAKGTQSKMIVFNKLQESFPGSFWEDEGKILRIPLNEDGSCVEIKVTLTAAKNILGDGAVASAFQPSPQDNIINEPVPAVEITEEEKERVAQLIKSLGL